LGNTIFFDFDGTIVDSSISIKKTYEDVLHNHFPSKVNFLNEITIGPKLKDVISDILNLDDSDSNIFYKKFIDLHDNKNIDLTTLYPDATEVLKNLSIDNKIIILTNKRRRPTEYLLKKFNLNSFLDDLMCGDDIFVNTKRAYISNMFLKNKIICDYFVGDMPEDGKVANNFNIPFYCAAYGYGNHLDWKGISIEKKIFSMRDLISF
jgi:phosphoglycolate phosphatase-like HAD superfamily hydrolase